MSNMWAVSFRGQIIMDCIFKQIRVHKLVFIKYDKPVSKTELLVNKEEELSSFKYANTDVAILKFYIKCN